MTTHIANETRTNHITNEPNKSRTNEQQLNNAITKSHI